METPTKITYWFGVEKNDVVLLLLIVTSLLIMLQEEKKDRFKMFVSDKIFLANISLAVAFSIWIIHFQKVEDAKSPDDKARRIKLRKSLFLGYLAFIIALCAAFDLVVLPFWVVWVSSYYFDLS